MPTPEIVEQVAVRDGDQIVGSYTPTELEHAFYAGLKGVFDVSLHDGIIDNFGRLVRVSDPVRQANSTLAFQYTRYDLLRNANEDAVQLLLPQNPQLAKTIGDLTWPEPNTFSGEDFDKIDAILVEEERFLTGLQQRIVDRDGKLSPFLALTDPAYYTEGQPLQQWPESIQFVVFDADHSDQLLPSSLDKHGRVEGIRPRIHGFLGLQANFNKPNFLREANLIVSYPQAYYEIARAYTTAFEYDDPNEIKIRDEDIEDYTISETSDRLDIKIPILLRPTETELLGNVREITVFVSELAR